MFTKRDSLILSIIISTCLVALSFPYLRDLVENSRFFSGSFEANNGEEVVIDNVRIRAPKVKAAEKGKMDINKAGLEDLKQLNGVGEVIAERILEYRKNHGEYESIDQVGEVVGVGDSILEKIKKKAQAG